MLKDKNVVKAMELVEKEGVDVNMPLEKLAELHTELEIAEKAYEDQAEIVKEHSKTIYAPMCEKKTELEIRMQALRIKFAKVMAHNPGFAALVKLAKKTAAKRGK